MSIFLGVAVDEIVCWPTDVSSGGTKQKLRDKLPNKLAGNYSYVADRLSNQQYNQANEDRIQLTECDNYG